MSTESPAASTETRRLAAAGAVGAGSLLAYLAAKPRFHGPAAWRLPALSAGASATAYSLLEAVPVLLVLGGLVAFERTRTPPRAAAERAGFATTVGSVHGLVLAHFAEHLLPPVPVPGTPVDDVYVYLYFGLWVLAAAGLGLYGLGVLAADGPSATGAVLAAALPLGVLAGAAAVAIGVDAFGDGLKLPFALVAAATAYRAWVASREDATARGGSGVD